MHAAARLLDAAGIAHEVLDRNDVHEQGSLWAEDPRRRLADTWARTGAAGTRHLVVAWPVEDREEAEVLREAVGGAPHHLRAAARLA